MSKEIKCSECGILNEDSGDCLNCGSNLEKQSASIKLCSDCNNLLSDNKKFCVYCGSETGKDFYIKDKRKESRKSAVILIVLFTGMIAGLCLVLIIKNIYSHSPDSSLKASNNLEISIPVDTLTPASTPVPEEKSKETLTSGSDISEAEKTMFEKKIKEVLQGWIDSRAALDIDWYMSYYSPDFYHNGKKINYYELKSYKKDLYSYYLSINENIHIKIEDVHFEFFTSEKVKVKFTQYYYSNTYDDKGIMTLILRKENGRWLILDENFTKLY